MFTFEMAGAYTVERAMDLMVEATARTIWTGDRDPQKAKDCHEIPCYDSSTYPPTVGKKGCSYNPPYCQSGNCFAGVFNFIGRQLESAQSRFAWLGWTEIKGGSVWDWPKYFGQFVNKGTPSVENRMIAARKGMEFVKRAGDRIWHPSDPSWKIFNENRPIMWGNGTMWDQSKAMEMADATVTGECHEERLSDPNYKGAVCSYGKWDDDNPNALWMLVTPAQRNRIGK